MAGRRQRTGLDPGGILLRKAARVAVVLPLSLALGSLIGDLAATYAAFGSFALLVFADFGGPPARRFRAYVVASAVGSVLLVVGTLASVWVPLAVLTALVVAFCVSFSAVLRGYVAAGGPAVQLVFVLAVTLRADPSGIPAQLAGWVVGAALATASALVLWPSRRRSVLRTPTAAALSAVAALVRRRWVDGEQDPSAELTAMLDRTEELQQQYGGKPFRPAGASARDRGFMQVIDELARLRVFLLWAVRDRSPHLRTGSGTPGDVALAAATADMLERSARTMLGETSVTAADVAGYRDQRDRHREASAAWVEQESAAGRPAGGLVEALSRSYALRVTSFLVGMAAIDAAAAQGVTAQSMLVRHQPESVWATLRTQLSWQSPWLRNAVRAGTGVALGVTVALLTGVEHGFWVVLGVLSVLRFDALGTGRTALQAIAGTVGGFLVGTAVILTAGGNLTVLWLLLPALSFLAAWAPARLGFPVGQAAFTVFVIVMFGIVAYPPQVATGLVRVEDVLLGAAVSLAVGLLLWPRGVVPLLERTTAAAFRDAAAYLDAAVRSLAGRASDDEVDAARRLGDEGASRAGETFDLSLMQRGPGLPDVAAWSRQAGAPGHIVAIADMVVAIRSLQPAVRLCPGVAAAMTTESESVRAELEGVAQVLDGGSPPGGRTLAEDDPPDERSTPLLDRAAECVLLLRHPAPAPDGASVAVAVWINDWLTHLGWVAGRARTRASGLVGAPPPPAR